MTTQFYLEQTNVGVHEVINTIRVKDYLMWSPIYNSLSKIEPFTLGLLKNSKPLTPLYL